MISYQIKSRPQTILFKVTYNNTHEMWEFVGPDNDDWRLLKTTPITDGEIIEVYQSILDGEYIRTTALAVVLKTTANAVAVINS